MRKEGKGREEKEKKKRKERERTEEEKGGKVERGGVVVVSVGVSVGAKGQWSRNENEDRCGIVPLKSAVLAVQELRRGLSAEPRWGSGGLRLQFCTGGCEQPPCEPGICCLRQHGALGMQHI